MKRVLIIGSGGAGKSTLARRLGDVLKLDVVHLDAQFWRAGWERTPKDVWARRVEEMIARDRWIIDGNFGGTLERRLEACDTIVFLDMPRLVCIWRVIKRRVRYRKSGRPDMAEGCAEHLSREFLSWIWNYPTRSRPAIREKLEKLSGDKRVFILDSRAGVESFVSGLKANQSGARRDG